MNIKRWGSKSKKIESFIQNNKAQFFLIAAVVIIIVVVSVVTITNYIEKKDVVKLYDLGQELGIESQNVLDYGTYSELNEAQMKDLMESFITNYVSYIGNDKNIYFLFGNYRKINLAGYQEVMAEEVCLKTVLKGQTEETTVCTPYLTIGQTQEYPSPTPEDEISKVVIRIVDMEYQFALSEGENFYFIIWQNIQGETHVITSET